MKRMQKIMDSGLLMPQTTPDESLMQEELNDESH
jgi:hypothetical protein